MRDDRFIASGLRRVTTYLHLQELFAGREVAEVWDGPADPRGWQTLAAHGARHIVVVSSLSRPEPRVEAPNGKGREVQRAVGDTRRTNLASASVEVLIALDIDPARLVDVVHEARRVLVPDGVLVLGVASRDVPDAQGGASYFDVVDACAAFANTRMLGVAPFVGTSLVEYGVREPEPVLDGTLVERGERVEQYVAVAGPPRVADFGYGVVQVPLASVDLRGDDAGLRSALARAEAELVSLRAMPVARAEAKVETKDDSARIIAELRRALELHAAEMRARELELAERSAYIAELEGNSREHHALIARVAEAERQKTSAEQLEREARRKLAELEGLRLAAGPVVANDEVEKLKQRLAAAESESWKQMKGRSEAEAAAALLREENLRKLTDARKVAQAELMRAMEDAAKKAISLRDDLERTEKARKAAVAELEALKQAPPVDRARAEEQARVIESQAKALDELRAELAGEARKHEALDQDRPSHQMVENLRVELDGLRARVAELSLDLQRRDAGVERAAALAAHERARAERLIADERQALSERNDARAKAAEALAQVAGLKDLSERAQAALELAEHRAEKAEQEVDEKRDRIKKLKREIEELEHRASHGVARGRALELVRARVHALELAVLGEANRLAGLEATLRATS